MQNPEGFKMNNSIILPNEYELKRLLMFAVSANEIDKDGATEDDTHFAMREISFLFLCFPEAMEEMEKRFKQYVYEESTEDKIELPDELHYIYLFFVGLNNKYSGNGNEMLEIARTMFDDYDLDKNISTEFRHHFATELRLRNLFAKPKQSVYEERGLRTL